MNKLYIVIFLAFVLLFTACTQDKEIAAIEGSEKEWIELSVSMPTEGDSRLSYTEEGNETYHFAWEEGDKLVVLAHEDATRTCTTFELDLKEGVGTSTATFSGFVNTRDYQRFLIAYKSKNLLVDTANFNFSFNYPSDFVQDNNAPTKHLKDNLFLMSSLVLKEHFGKKISLSMQNVLLRVDINAIDERIGDLKMVKCIFHNQDKYGKYYTTEKCVLLKNPIPRNNQTSVYFIMPETECKIITAQCVGTEKYGNISRDDEYSEKTLKRGTRYNFSIATLANEGNLYKWEVKMPSKPILVRFSDMDKTPDSDAKYYSPIKVNVDGTDYWSYNPKDLEQSILYSFDYRISPKITEVIIPDNINELGEFCFSECSLLTTVKGCESVNSIGDYVFNKCSALTTLPSFDKVTGKVGQNAFSYCTKLENLSAFTNVTELGFAAFKECTNLKTLPEFRSLKILGSSAFEGCTGLTTLPSFENVNYIDANVFYNCTNLKDIPVFNKVTTFNAGITRGCPLITDISNKFPNVTTLGLHVYEGWNQLRKLPLFEKVTTIPGEAYANTDFSDPTVAITVGHQVNHIESYAFAGSRNCTINILVDPKTCSVDDNMFGDGSFDTGKFLYLNEEWLKEDGNRKPTKTIGSDGKVSYSWFGWPWVNITLVKVNEDNVTFTVSDKQL